MLKLTDRQEEIINAAAQIIAEQGAQNLSMRSVAESVGFSEPALYRHFDNKDNLVLKMISHIAQDAKETLQWTDNPNQPALAQLEKLLKHALKSFSDQWTYTATLYATHRFYNSPEVVEELQSVFESGTVNIQDLLRRSQIEGAVIKEIPCEHMAIVIFGTIRLLIERWNLSQRSFDLQVAWEIVWKTLKTMLTVPVR